MSVSIVVLIVGAIFLAIGLIGGGIKIGVKEGEASIPTMKPTARILSSIIGIGFIAFGLWRDVNPPNTSLPVATESTSSLSVPAPLDTSTPIPTPAPTFTSTPACPYQEKTDHETIVNLIQAEAEASNTKSIAIMQTIFAPDAIFYDDAPDPPKSWAGPLARYKDDLFAYTDLKDEEHFDILPVGPGIAGNMAWYTSGSKGFYRINGGVWTEFFNGSLVSTPPTQYGSEHWILKKNSIGCWTIIQMEFDAGHEEFPPK
jgi:hypothetical protein